MSLENKRSPQHPGCRRKSAEDSGPMWDLRWRRASLREAGRPSPRDHRPPAARRTSPPRPRAPTSTCAPSRPPRPRAICARGCVAPTASVQERSSQSGHWPHGAPPTCRALLCSSPAESLSGRARHVSPPSPGAAVSGRGRASPARLRRLAQPSADGGEPHLPCPSPAVPSRPFRHQRGVAGGSVAGAPSQRAVGLVVIGGAVTCRARPDRAHHQR
jgi:hypothetical protein